MNLSYILIVLLFCYIVIKKFQIIISSLLSSMFFLSICYAHMYFFSPLREKMNYISNRINVHVIFPQFIWIFVIVVIVSSLVMFLVTIVTKLVFQRQPSKKAYFIVTIALPIALSAILVTLTTWYLSLERV